ncbi:MAG: hypothetical protein AB7S75_25695 [Desulfococcaceae bacterium]
MTHYQKKNPPKTPPKKPRANIPLLFEIICPGAVFAGEITVEEKHPDAPIKSPVSAEKLLPSADMFYMGEKKREDDQLSKIGVSSFPGFSAEKMALLRIGRHCGAESLTIEGYRSIKILQGRGNSPKELDHATTLWLASEQRKPANKQNLIPFGWAELLDARAEREKIRRAEEAAEAEAQKLADLAAEVARKQAAFAAMSIEDRAIADVRNPAVPEQRVVEIYKGLDSFPADRKKELAAVIKERWMREKGKWGKKKECSGKQWEKISKIKEILGE